MTRMIEQISSDYVRGDCHRSSVATAAAANLSSGSHLTSPNFSFASLDFIARFFRLVHALSLYHYSYYYWGLSIRPSHDICSSTCS